jgi:hypothetical protein
MFIPMTVDAPSSAIAAQATAAGLFPIGDIPMTGSRRVG